MGYDRTTGQQGDGRRPGRPATDGAQNSVATVVRAADDDAARDGFSRGFSRSVALLPLVGTVGLLVIYLIHRPALYWIMREDHPVEWGQFALCAFCCVVAGLAAVRCARRGDVRVAVLLVVAALGFLVLAGEEISWGQRVFGLVTPESLAKANLQQETNLHNIKNLGFSLDDVLQITQFLLGAVAILVSLLARRTRPRLTARMWWLLAPPLFTLPGYALMSVYRAAMVVVPESASPLVVYQEWVEFCFYLSAAITLVCCHRRSAAPDSLDAAGRHSRSRPSRFGISATPIGIVAVTVLLLTLVCAVLTARTGIVPGNVPVSQR